MVLPAFRFAQCGLRALDVLVDDGLRDAQPILRFSPAPMIVVVLVMMMVLMATSALIVSAGGIGALAVYAISRTDIHAPRRPVVGRRRHYDRSRRGLISHDRRRDRH